MSSDKINSFVSNTQDNKLPFDMKGDQRGISNTLKPVDKKKDSSLNDQINLSELDVRDDFSNDDRSNDSNSASLKSQDVNLSFNLKNGGMGLSKTLQPA